MSRPIAIASRARSDEQKQLRRQLILDAADTLFNEVGFEAFSMATLARRAGVVKGTLYLYFDTREEVLLTLFGDRLNAWRERLQQAVSDEMGDRELVTQLYETTYADLSLLKLLSRLGSVIEHNVSLDTLINSKRHTARELAEVSALIASPMNLSPARANEALVAFTSLLLGVFQADTGPRFDNTQLPEDVRAFMEAFHSKDMFITNACRILAGIRNESIDN